MLLISSLSQGKEENFREDLILVPLVIFIVENVSYNHCIVLFLLFDYCFIDSTNLIIIYIRSLTVEQPKVGYISIDILTETLEGI